MVSKQSIALVTDLIKSIEAAPELERLMGGKQVSDLLFIGSSASNPGKVVSIRGVQGHRAPSSTQKSTAIMKG